MFRIGLKPAAWEMARKGNHRDFYEQFESFIDLLFSIFDDYVS